MNAESEKTMGQAGEATLAATPSAVGPVVRHELAHLRSGWCWFLLLGILLVLCGTTAITFPIVTSVAAVSVLAVLLMVSGVATIIAAFWAGKWSGFLVQLLVGIMYVAAGLVVTERPLFSIFLITIFVAVSFIVVGLFRTVAALLIRFPQWEWALLNGMITLLAGIIIYRHLPLDALWVVGLLVGLEMLFNGLTWIMLALGIRRIVKA